MASKYVRTNGRRCGGTSSLDSAASVPARAAPLLDVDPELMADACSSRWRSGLSRPRCTPPAAVVVVEPSADAPGPPCVRTSAGEAAPDPRPERRSGEADPASFEALVPREGVSPLLRRGVDGPGAGASIAGVGDVARSAGAALPASSVACRARERSPPDRAPAGSRPLGRAVVGAARSVPPRLASPRDDDWLPSRRPDAVDHASDGPLPGVATSVSESRKLESASAAITTAAAIIAERPGRAGKTRAGTTPETRAAAACTTSAAIGSELSRNCNAATTASDRLRRRSSSVPVAARVGALRPARAAATAQPSNDAIPIPRGVRE